MSGGLISSGWRRSGVGERDLWHHRVAHEKPITKCALHPAELSVCHVKDGWFRVQAFRAFAFI